MAINVGTAVAYLTLDRSSFKNSLASAGADLKNFASSGDVKSLGSAMTSVGKDMTVGMTLPLVGVGTVAAKTSMDFEAQMSKVKAISGATGKDFNDLREQAIQLGADTNFSASEAAEGMENLASAGFKNTEIMKAMPGMLDLAAAGDVSIADASDIASSALRGFGMEADKTTHVADVLAKAAGDTNAGIIDTGEAMKYIAPVAHSLGISFEDTTAAIGLLSNAGIKGSQAGTTLRGALTSLASPSKKASDVMKQLGMNFFDAQGKMLPLGQVIQQLQDKTKGLTQQQKASTMETLFGKEAMSGMLALVDQGGGKFNELSNGLKKCDGAGHEMATTMQDNLKGSIEAMKGSIETAAIRIGDVLAPGIKKAANFIADLTNKFSTLPKPIQTVIVYVGLFLASIGPVMLIFSKIVGMFAPAINLITKLGGAISGLSKTFSAIKTGASIFSSLPALINPPVLIIIGVIAGLALIVYEVIKHWDFFKKYIFAFGTFIKNVFKSIWDFIDKVVKGWIIIFQAFGELLKKVVKGWEIIFSAFGEFLKKVALGWISIFSNLGKGMFEIGKNIVEGLIDGVKFMFGKVGEVISNLGSKIKDGFKSILGIHSPSRVFMEYGGFIGEGLINGIDGQEKNIDTKFSGIANKIKGLASTKVQFSGLDGISKLNSLDINGSKNIGTTNKQFSLHNDIKMYVTVADTGEKGTKQLTDNLKTMAQNSLKDAQIELFMNDVVRN
ncbi:phage tail tape measure protein [Clostridium sp. JS66]|uniref:phage tail tape measure protein n=1 Tax=Clostridium sp. JS66 TaxID=3064705 RepID=UPI00298D7830|nr:phage tail tape measure protein [Clostridium sp. JS66]WPC42965.1 phage tail tape measure protein [Clostridium sp. JS66]